MWNYRPVVPTVPDSPKKVRIQSMCDPNEDDTYVPQPVPRERVREVSVMILLDTNRRHECPRFVRERTETAAAFADRVRDLLIQMQGKIE